MMMQFSYFQLAIKNILHQLPVGHRQVTGQLLSAFFSLLSIIQALN